jgi:hypothetical protein
MTTQQLPVVDDLGPRRITVGAGTAVKVGFFFALGVTLFSLVVSIIFGVITAALGLTLLPHLPDLFGN